MGAAAPDGETLTVLLDRPGVRVERMAGAVSEPVDYLQPEDEWVVLLRGDAELVVGGAARALVPGDWLLLPGGTPHTLVRASADAVWLAVWPAEGAARPSGPHP